jgi:hypothetical protein
MDKCCRATRPFLFLNRFLSINNQYTQMDGMVFICLTSVHTILWSVTDPLVTCIDLSELSEYFLKLVKWWFQR